MILTTAATQIVTGAVVALAPMTGNIARWKFGTSSGKSDSFRKVMLAFWDG